MEHGSTGVRRRLRKRTRGEVSRSGRSHQSRERARSLRRSENQRGTRGGDRPAGKAPPEPGTEPPSPEETENTEHPRGQPTCREATARAEHTTTRRGRGEARNDRPPHETHHRRLAARSASGVERTRAVHQFRTRSFYPDFLDNMHQKRSFPRKIFSLKYWSR